MSDKILDRFSNTLVHFAPMVGISHFAVRKAISEYLGPNETSLWPTEMLSSRRLTSQNEGQVPEVIVADKANGLCPQLLGNEENFIAESVKKLESWGARAIDINMGCPVKKALQHNYGVALMGDSDYAARVTGYAVKHAKIPVSVKLRAGLQKDPEFLLTFAKALENAGASWITIHPRTASEKRRGSADWNQIKFLKQALKIPVIGNGDIQCLEDVVKMKEETGCDRVMAGRALLAKPWMIRANTTLKAPNLEEQSLLYERFLKRVLQISREVYPEPWAMRKLRFLVFHSSVWLEWGHHLYASMKGAETFEAAENVLNTFFAEPQRMRDRTSLVH